MLLFLCGTVVGDRCRRRSTDCWGPAAALAATQGRAFRLLDLGCGDAFYLARVLAAWPGCSTSSSGEGGAPATGGSRSRLAAYTGVDKSAAAMALGAAYLREAAAVGGHHGAGPSDGGSGSGGGSGGGGGSGPPPTICHAEDDILDYVLRRAEEVAAAPSAEAADAQRFDVVLASFAVHHLSSESKARLVRSLPALLLPGGCFILVDIFRQPGATQCCEALTGTACALLGGRTRMQPTSLSVSCCCCSDHLATATTSNTHAASQHQPVALCCRLHYTGQQRDDYIASFLRHMEEEWMDVLTPTQHTDVAAHIAKFDFPEELETYQGWAAQPAAAAAVAADGGAAPPAAAASSLPSFRRAEPLLSLRYYKAVVFEP